MIYVINLVGSHTNTHTHTHTHAHTHHQICGDRAAEMKTRLVNAVQHKARQNVCAFPNETQTNSTYNKRANNVKQSLSKVLSLTHSISRDHFSPQGVISRDLVPLPKAK